jgi:branched-chain amino acid transport system ATP-binding protein
MPELLAIERLTAGYGEAVVLNAVSLALAEGQSLALLGRNGMGKTTLINSIVGVTRYVGGSITLDGRDLTALRPDQRAHAGIGWVPQERNQLSGGEQQMLAVGRALILNPRVMLLDEPLEGLAPILVEELLAALRRIIRDEGTSAILVEQNAQKVLAVTDRAAILERGAVVYQGASADLLADRAMLESHLGVTAAGPRRAGRSRH